MIAIVASLFLEVAAVPPAELLREPVVLDFCRVLLEKAASERFREQGAFVVRTSDGLLYFVAWPPGDDKDRLHWYGRYPEGTVAIVHTHPPWVPEPSKLDVRAARRAGIPVYVITPSGIAKTTGEEPVMVVGTGWAPEGRGSASAKPLRSAAD